MSEVGESYNIGSDSDQEPPTFTYGSNGPHLKIGNGEMIPIRDKEHLKALMQKYGRQKTPVATL